MNPIDALADGVACAASKEVTIFIAVPESILIGRLKERLVCLPSLALPAGNSKIAIVREVPFIVAVIDTVLILHRRGH